MTRPATRPSDNRLMPFAAVLASPSDGAVMPGIGSVLVRFKPLACPCTSCRAGRARNLHVVFQIEVILHAMKFPRL